MTQVLLKVRELLTGDPNLAESEAGQVWLFQRRRGRRQVSQVLLKPKTLQAWFLQRCTPVCGTKVQECGRQVTDTQRPKVFGQAVVAMVLSGSSCFFP